MRACMVAYAFYDSDNRVRRYAETLARRGDHVDAISLRQEGQKSFDNINGVNVFRIQERERNVCTELVMARNNRELMVHYRGMI